MNIQNTSNRWPFDVCNVMQFLILSYISFLLEMPKNNNLRLTSDPPLSFPRLFSVAVYLTHCGTPWYTFKGFKEIFFFPIQSNQAATLANSIAGITSKIVVTILSGENPARVVVLLPSPGAGASQGGAVVRAAVVHAVHVGHQNLDTKGEVLF